jgi:hypothetical protein
MSETPGGPRGKMRLQGFYPVIVTPRGRECRDFYQTMSSSRSSRRPDVGTGI